MNHYLILGDELLRQNQIKSITSQIQKKYSSEVSTQTFDLSETSLSDLVTIARTLPFLVEAQIIIAKRAERLKERKSEALENYLNSFSDFTYFIFEGEDLSPKHFLRELIKDHGKVFQIASREIKSEAGKYLKQKLHHFNKSMTPRAQGMVLDMCGETVMFLDTILDRLIQFAGEEEIITEDMVSTFEENWTGMNVYDLTNALLAKDRNGAFKVFREFVDLYQANIIELIGLLHWQLKRLWQAKVLLSSGVSEKMALERCGVRGGAQQYFLRDLRKFSLEKLEEGIENLYQVDLGMKTGRIQNEFGLEKWMIELTA